MMRLCRSPKCRVVAFVVLAMYSVLAGAVPASVCSWQNALQCVSTSAGRVSVSLRTEPQQVMLWPSVANISAIDTKHRVVSWMCGGLGVAECAVDLPEVRVRCVLREVCMM